MEDLKPASMSSLENADLYKQCGLRELKYTIREARWRMLGHVLRMSDDTPAKYATMHYFDKINDRFLVLHARHLT